MHPKDIHVSGSCMTNLTSSEHLHMAVPCVHTYLPTIVMMDMFVFKMNKLSLCFSSYILVIIRWSILVTRGGCAKHLKEEWAVVIKSISLNY